MRSKARRNLYQRLRTRQRPCEYFQGDQYCVKNSSHLQDKILVCSCLWLGRSASWDAGRRSDSGHCSLAAMWSKDPGLARGSKRFRIDSWPLTSAPATIPLDLQLRLASIATKSQDGNLRRQLRRHAKDKRWQREGRSSCKQDTTSPSGEVRSKRDQVTASMRDMTRNGPGLIAKLDHEFQSKHQHNRRTGARAGVVWSCAEEGTAAALGHTSASEYGLSCRPHELGETKG